MDEWIWDIGGMMVTVESRSNRIEITATSYTINPTRIGLGLNPGLSSENRGRTLEKTHCIEANIRQNVAIVEDL